MILVAFSIMLVFVCLLIIILGGNNWSHKNQRYTRGYVNLNSPDDILEFAEFLTVVFLSLKRSCLFKR